MAENDSPKLTRKQRKTIVGLIENHTIGDAAKQSGVSESAIYRWMKLEVFNTALDDAIGSAIDGGVRRLIAGREEAFNVLYDLMKNAEKENVRRMAAKDWLEQLHKYVEAEIVMKRLERIEIYFEETRLEKSGYTIKQT